MSSSIPSKFNLMIGTNASSIVRMLFTSHCSFNKSTKDVKKSNRSMWIGATQSVSISA
ncbi:hypothetical protein X975_25310, partial [Stegodyphus mimosarum]